MIQSLKKIFGLGAKIKYDELVAEGAVMLDVRTTAEYQAGHIRGSVNIPVDQLKNNLNLLPDKGKPIITCCASGMRSASARQILISNGYKSVFNGGSWVTLKKIFDGMSTGNQLLMLWQEGRTRFTNLLSEISESDLTKKLPPAPNSAGFIIRHIGDVEFLFAKNVFQLPDLNVHAKTVIAQRDTGEWTSLSELVHYVGQSAEVLKRAIELQREHDWAQTITTKEFGTKTKAESLGRIITHTAYHAGQLKLFLKYGQP